MAVIRGLVDELQAFAGDPSRFLKEINRALVAHQVTNAPVFATALYMVVDAANGQVQCASAGHPSPFWMRRDLGHVEPLVTGSARNGPVLGLLGDADYPATQHTLAVNDAILHYTDGLCEVRNANEETYGAERVQAFLQERLAQPCDHLLQALILDARRYAPRGEFEDDVCLVSVQLAKYL
jgi:sigma-B regulation protein RsbU (phosphoserine phosphatase)